MIPSCIESDIRGVVLSILSIILGLVITLFPLKITLIYIGVIGIFISILTSGINKRKIIEAKNLILKKPL